MAFRPYDGDIGDIQPRGMFEGTGERAFLHNLVANPELAKKYLRSLGDEIIEYGKGWDFAFRKRGSNTPWTPAESHTFGGWILNHVADAVIGAGTGVAAALAAGAAIESGPGAIAAGAGAGALASGGLEAARQFVGHLAGVPENLDVTQIAAATAGGALAEPLGAAGGAIVRGAGRAIRTGLRKAAPGLAEVAAKLADIKALGAVGPGLRGKAAGTVLTEGAALSRGGRVPLIDPENAGDILRDAVRWINRVKFPEITEADARAAAETGFDLSRAMKAIEDRTLGKQIGFAGVTKERAGFRTNVAASPTESIPFHTRVTTNEPIFEAARTAALREERVANPSISADAADLLARIRSGFGLRGFAGDFDNVPGNVATSIRRVLRREASEAGAFQGIGGGKSKAYVKMVKTAHAKVRAAIVRRMESSTVEINPRFSGVSYANLEKSAYDRLNTLDFLNAKLRIADMSDAGRDAAVRYVRGVYGENKIAYLSALNKLDSYFSTGIRGRLVDRAVTAIQRANIGAAIGNRGIGELLPRITSGGHIRSAGALIGVSAYAGGPLGAVTAGVVSSPKFILSAVGPVSRAGAAAQSAAGALARVHLGGASRVIAVGTVDAGSVALMREAIRQEGGGTKPLARQEEGKRRRILIGG